MKAANQRLLETAIQEFDLSDSNVKPTVKLVAIESPNWEYIVRLLKRLRIEGVKSHHRAPDYLLQAAGIELSIYKAWSTDYALRKLFLKMG